MSTTGALPFTVNERVLCYHGPLIYEAKVLKTEMWDETNTKLAGVGPHFFVHYKGWKQTWDEWVPVARLLKFNETNVALQKALSSQASQAASSSGAGSKKGAGGSGSGGAGGGTGPGTGRGGRKDGRGTKRGREEDDSNRKPEMKMNVPEVLKVLLVDDWEAITKNNQLVSLPRTPNVIEILQEFKDLRDPDLVLPTIISGLTVYFDRSLGANLLYRFERPQYAEIRKTYVTGPTVKVGQEKDMSSIYGAEHLLRMLVSLPQMVVSSTMDAESIGLVKDYVNELLSTLCGSRCPRRGPGGEIPAVNVKEDNPEKGFTLDLSGKNIIFSGASVYDKYKAKGIKDICVVAVNDAFATKAWKEKLAPQGTGVRFIAGELTSSLGLISDASGLLGSPHSKVCVTHIRGHALTFRCRAQQRYAIVAQDNKVQFIAVETKPADTTMTASEVVLSQIA
ncbi:MRG-domain-containing protein [Boletus reticuloceps]|uniref:Chromatin modification-related protein EAF3 n=1 Tax=Boletus reticuloceps TaxID=495285 RepID=A0A8I2YJ11_9AGAM|nr:MRG-domain-containing protein [Boletus reticuloceps]